MNKKFEREAQSFNSISYELVKTYTDLQEIPIPTKVKISGQQSKTGQSGSIYYKICACYKGKHPNHSKETW